MRELHATGGGLSPAVPSVQGKDSWHGHSLRMLQLCVQKWIIREGEREVSVKKMPSSLVFYNGRHKYLSVSSNSRSQSTGNKASISRADS